MVARGYEGAVGRRVGEDVQLRPEKLYGTLQFLRRHQHEGALGLRAQLFSEPVKTSWPSVSTAPRFTK
jgi:hypothetical protein